MYGAVFLTGFDNPVKLRDIYIPGIGAISHLELRCSTVLVMILGAGAHLLAMCGRPM